ncbi:MAG: hypothetical protein QXK06_02155 [Candidatus Diapherotrites archaeon]
MKKEIFQKIFAILVFFLFFASVKADTFNIPLARFGLVQSIGEKKAIFENQIKPIVETFRLNADISSLEDCANKSTTIQGQGQCQNTIEIAFQAALPYNDMYAQTKYSLLRDGIEFQPASSIPPSKISLGDTIRIEPQIVTQEISHPIQDWTVQGASTDTPPIEILSSREFNTLAEMLTLRQRERYPASGELMDALRVEKFKTEVVPWTGGNSYVGFQGKTYHVVELAGGKKAGVLIACAESISATTYSGTCNSDPLSDSVECHITKMPENRKAEIVINPFFNCFIHFDRIFTGSIALQADWFGQTFGNVPKSPLSFQVLPTGREKPPIAEFECNIDNCTPDSEQPKCLYCDASKSSDEDGRIESYFWTIAGSYTTAIGVKSKFYPQSLPKSTISITLKATDNQGFYSEKTKTFSVSEGTLKETGMTDKLSFIAEYNPSTKKAELTLSNCPPTAMQAFLDIDLLGFDAKPVLSILEKQPIACEKTTEVGPITAKGVYQATAKINSQTIQAIFSVP